VTPVSEPVSSHRLGPQDARDLSREVLLTDGLGGFALCSPAGVPTRCYSGLAQSLRPPVQRRSMFIAALETLEVAGREYTLHAFEVAPETTEGGGLNLLSHVDLHDLLPTRVQLAGGVWVARTSFVPQRSGSLVQLYELEAPQDVTLTLGALLTDRDMHEVCTRTPELNIVYSGQEFTVTGNGAPAHQIGLRLWTTGTDATADVQALAPRPVPQRLHFRLDTARGAPDTERAVATQLWRVRLPAGIHRLALVVGDAALVGDPWQAHDAERQRRHDLTEQTFRACGVQDALTATLALSADSFLVQRQVVGGQFSGQTMSPTVIAGYPWFADWGRDSMIALTGLTLVTGRLDEARGLLETFLSNLRRGLTPNNFHDDGSGAGYNTVDGALWLIVALERYLRASSDDPGAEVFARRHLEAVRGILLHHLEGTDYGIQTDPADGLLLAGEAGVQLTWMDVKIHDWVVTPRHGKPVEIQALWAAALAAESRLSRTLGEEPQYAGTLVRAQAALLQFWNPEDGFLYDVLDQGGTPDASIRPNALIALALQGEAAAPEHVQAALLTAGRELLTPLGLRTLGRSDPHYLGNYGGSQLVRDAAYHQGTVWPWPLGSYTELLLQRGQVHQARAALAGLCAHLWEAGLGSVSEVFSGDALTPGGCPFQAWSVAELLRAHVLVSHAERRLSDQASAEQG
jgi:glycogen debranching enzyme